MRRYYHGSRVRLVVGDFLLPPSLTKVLCSRDLGYVVAERDSVYLCGDFDEAATYALTRLLPASETVPEGRTSRREFVGIGLVYEAIPDRITGPDPEYADWPVSHDYAVTCRRARIVAVHPVPAWLVMARMARHCRETGKIPAIAGV